MASLLPRYIPQAGLDALAKYKYSAEDHSFLKKLFLGAYWDWAIGLFPLWIAFYSDIFKCFLLTVIHYSSPNLRRPNLLTFGGFWFLFSNFLIATYYCTAAVGCEAPSWIFYWTALSLFIYQTLDNIDGKQARRTGSSSPLGELFDHGVDSLFLLFTGMPFFLAVGTSAWESFWFLTFGVAAFYWTHWEEFHTDTLVMGLVANPTEVQCTLMVLFVSAGYVGKAYFAQTMSQLLPVSVTQLILDNNVNYYGFLDMQLKFVILLLVIFGVSATCLSLAPGSWAAAMKKGHSIEKPLLRLAPQLIHFAAMYYWAANSKFDVLHNQTHMFLTLHGMIFSYQCDQLLLCRICLMEFSWYNFINLIPILGAINASLATPLVDESIALPALFGVFMVIYVYFVVSVIGQFTSHLKIHAFKIAPPSKLKKAD